MVELLGRLLCLTGCILSVLMRCLLAGATGESCSAMSRVLGAALEQKLAFLGLAHSAFGGALAFVSALELQQC